MCSSQAGDWHTERRAGNIVVTDQVTPLDRTWVTAVLAADTYFQIRAGLATFGNCPFHELADTAAIQRLEGICLEDALFLIGDQEVAFGIIAGVTVGHLGQVVRAKGEELSAFSNLASCDGRTRDFDHGTELVFELDVLLFHDGGRNPFEPRLDPFKL